MDQAHEEEEDAIPSVQQKEVDDRMSDESAADSGDDIAPATTPPPTDGNGGEHDNSGDESPRPLTQGKNVTHPVSLPPAKTIAKTRSTSKTTALGGDA